MDHPASRRAKALSTKGLTMLTMYTYTLFANRLKANQLFANRIAQGWRFENRFCFIVFIWKRKPTRAGKEKGSE
jgi:hypothetical protein